MQFKTCHIGKFTNSFYILKTGCVNIDLNEDLLNTEVPTEGKKRSVLG